MSYVLGLELHGQRLYRRVSIAFGWWLDQ